MHRRGRMKMATVDRLQHVVDRQRTRSHGDEKDYSISTPVRFEGLHTVPNHAHARAAPSSPNRSPAWRSASGVTEREERRECAWRHDPATRATPSTSPFATSCREQAVENSGYRTSCGSRRPEERCGLLGSDFTFARPRRPPGASDTAVCRRSPRTRQIFPFPSSS